MVKGFSLSTLFSIYLLSVHLFNLKINLKKIYFYAKLKKLLCVRTEAFYFISFFACQLILFWVNLSWESHRALIENLTWGIALAKKKTIYRLSFASLTA